MTSSILLVEDETQVRSFVKGILLREGFEVIEAKDGTAAIHEIWKCGGKVTAMVTDIDMGRMNGMELAESVRSQFPALPVLFLSALPIPPNELDSIAPGSVLVSKPFHPEDLVAALRKLIGSA